MSEDIRLVDLKPHERNYNYHSDAQIARIAKSLSTFGQVRSIVVWHNTILAGHGVVLAARSLGWDTIRADRIAQDHLTEAQALAYVVADNELARQSDPDQAQLAAILEELQAKEPLLVEAAGYSQEEVDQLLRLVGVGVDSLIAPEQARATLSERFLVPPFSVLDARQGYWQERKRAWIALGIQSELGRGAPAGGGEWPDSKIGLDGQNARQDLHMKVNPGGRTVRGDGKGKPMAMHDSANFPTPLASKRSYDRKRGGGVKMALETSPMVQRLKPSADQAVKRARQRKGATNG